MSSVHVFKTPSLDTSCLLDIFKLISYHDVLKTRSRYVLNKRLIFINILKTKSNMSLQRNLKY